MALTLDATQPIGLERSAPLLAWKAFSLADLDVMSLTETNGIAQSDDEEEEFFVRRLIALEEGAWSVCYQRYFPSLYRIAYARTLQHGVAEDIAAKVFLEAVASIGKYRYRGVPFRAWLFRIARFEIADYLKHMQRRPQVSIEDAPEPAFEIHQLVEDKTDLLRAMDGLTEMQKNVVIMRFMIGCSLAEVALALDKSIGAIKQLQARAVGLLQEALLPGGQG